MNKQEKQKDCVSCEVDSQLPIGTKSGFREIASTILWGYHRSNMTGWNDDNAVLVILNGSK